MSGYRFLREPRWLALGFLVLLVVPSFFLLSRWQFSRLDDRRHTNAVIESHAQLAPVPVDQVMRPGQPADAVGDDQRWRPVTATGHYVAAGQVLVRKRPFQGQNGFWVATPLITDSGATLVVNRGWIAAAGSALTAQDVPAPPSGVVTVTGRVQESEDAPRPQPGDLPPGQVTDLDVSLASAGATSVYPGYVELVASQPAEPDGLMPLPLPDLDEGPHLSYALQWIAFSCVAVTGFVMLVRRERQYAEDAPRGAADVAAAPPPPSTEDAAR